MLETAKQSIFKENKHKQKSKFKKTSTYFSKEHVVLTRNVLALQQIHAKNNNI